MVKSATEPVVETNTPDQIEDPDTASAKRAFLMPITLEELVEAQRVVSSIATKYKSPKAKAAIRSFAREMDLLDAEEARAAIRSFASFLDAEATRLSTCARRLAFDLDSLCRPIRALERKFGIEPDAPFDGPSPPASRRRPPPPARDDIGPTSAGEAARLSVRIDELQNDRRRLEVEAHGLRREIDELKAAAAKPAIAASRDDTAPDNSDEIKRKLTRLGRLEFEVSELRRERLALRDENAELKVEVARLKRENDAPRARGSKPDATAEMPEFSAFSDRGAHP
jgi:hypothetical protein